MPGFDRKENQHLHKAKESEEIIYQTIELIKHSGRTGADFMLEVKDYINFHSFSTLWELEFHIKFNIYFHQKSGFLTTEQQYNLFLS